MSDREHLHTDILRKSNRSTTQSIRCHTMHPICTVRKTKNRPFLYCVSWKWMTAEKDLLSTLKQVRAAHPYIHLRSPAFGSRPTPYVTAVR